MDVVLCLAFIEKDRMYTENANRSSGDGIITPDNMEPNPKNPIIASFFRNIGWSDRLGSGVRNIFKYSKYYSGEEPEFVEGDVFRLIVPLNEDYSYDNSKVEEIKKIYPKYPILLKIKTCINEFRKIFIKCSLPLLYLFMERYEHSKFVPISNFIKGLKKDIVAVENAVVSPLSNGFVEGINNRTKMIKRVMYGRCGIDLLSAKIILPYAKNG